MQVGLKKAIGNVIDDPDRYLGRDIKLLEKEARQKDKLVLYSSGGQYCGPALWVGDKLMMQSILDNHYNFLISVGWPVDASLFFRKISGLPVSVPHDQNTQLYHLINELFNSWCLFCEPRSGKNDEKGKMLSAHPYDPDEIIDYG